MQITSGRLLPIAKNIPAVPAKTEDTSLPSEQDLVRVGALLMRENTRKHKNIQINEIAALDFPIAYGE